MDRRQNKNKTVLTLDGELTVNKAALLKDQLLSSLEESDEIEIYFENVTAIDLSCLQLLHAAHSSARKKNKKLVLQAENAPLLRQAQAWTGFHL